MLNIGKLGAGAGEYYVGEVASSAEDYYAGRGESSGRWVGSLALELTRNVGHLILGAVQGKEALDGSSIEVPRGVPA